MIKVTPVHGLTEDNHTEAIETTLTSEVEEDTAQEIADFSVIIEKTKRTMAHLITEIITTKRKIYTKRGSDPGVG
ncbi:hypothetical protein DPMN_051650 [Dreissena polymorpha]|uniref:Uncharacterized protein n=1 Tax=Dreissena polymorpha TaxID=45954 RepID=A0A9D4HP38_DREPO|nr:hypothetical protein DPMN_051650 [Dreissena polymorpha]